MSLLNIYIYIKFIPNIILASLCADSSWKHYYQLETNKRSVSRPAANYHSEHTGDERLCSHSAKQTQEPSWKFYEVSHYN